MGPKFDSQAALVAQPLNLLVKPASAASQPTTSTNLASLTPFESISSELNTTIFNYFQLNPSPTFEGLGTRLQAALGSSADSIELTLDNRLATYAFTNLHEQGEAHLGIDLGGGREPQNLGADSTIAPVDLTVNLAMPVFTFNLERGSGRFYFNTPQVAFTVPSVAIQDTFKINSGFLAATVEAAAISQISTSDAMVKFRDPIGLGQLTTLEIKNYLDGTDSFRPFNDGSGGLGMSVVLPLHSTLGNFTTSATNPPTVTITDANLLDGVSPVYLSKDIGPIDPFDVIAAQQVIDLFNQVSLALDGMSGSSVLNAPIPFTSAETLGGNLHLGDLIQNTLVKNLTKTIINRDGNPVLVPTFATAQELVDQLSAILNVSDLTINPTYDPDTGELLFTLVLQTQNALLGVPLSVDRQDLGVELATKGTSLTLTENGTLTFTFGAELLATSSPKLSTSSPGQGIQGPVIPLDGKLTHDSTFTLTDDQNRVMRVTVPASSTMDNTSPLDLVGDFNAALQEAGVTSIVAGLDTLNPVMVGSGTFPGDGKLATDSHFTLTVDKNAPVSITVPQSVTTINSLSSDLVDEYNAAIEAAGISTVAASIAPPTQEIDGAKSLPGNGQLSGDATFTLTIDGGAATTVKVTQSVSSSDASPSDLVNAVNAALRAAGLSNIMAGLKSRVVGGVGETVLMLYAVQANQFDTITLHVAASDPAATELGFSDGEVGDNQPSMRFSGVAGTPIHLLTLTTPANDPLVTQLGFQPTQSEGFVSARLTLTASATKFLRFNAAADDPAIAELGFANDQSSRSSTNSSFVQGMSFLGGMSLSSPTGGEIPTGSFGFLGIASHSFAASANAQIDINIKDPNTGIVGGRVSLSDLKGLTATITTTGDLTAGSTTVEIKGDATGLAVGQGVEGTGIPADAIVTALSGTTITLNKAATQSVMGISLSFSKAPSLVQTPTAIGNGTFSLGFMVPKLGVDDQNYSLDASLGDVENPLPSFTVDTSHTGPFQNYQFLDFNTVENSLQQATNYLTEQTAFQDPSLSTWETVKNTGFLRKTVAENYGRRSQIAKNLGKSAILAC